MQEELSEVAAKRASEKAKAHRVFGHARKSVKMFRAGLYARVSTNDQQTIPLQIRALHEFAVRRGWTIALQIREVNSGVVRREAREKVLEAARRREIDLVLVWPVDNGSAGGPPGTGASGCRLRFSDGGVGPEHAGRSSHGRTACDFR